MPKSGVVIGRTIAHYKVTAKLGAGGMGEVYRATDTKLGREVALKVLPESFARDTERMARFSREAQVLAALNHPNISAIYGLEESDSARALVMELVEGQTLAERIAQGALPLDETLPLAKQIAEAMEYAHERGIVHRDLKPSNIKLTPEGQVKVLDFGLAKALADDPASATDLANSPTLSVAATKAGIILGTAAYMSPEQAKGKPSDRRADVWAFGVVLFEMLSGQRLYRGETASETLAAVIKDEPDWNQLPPNTPTRLRELLRRCLTKDPRHRLQAIGEARIVLENLRGGIEEAVPPPVSLREPRWRRVPPWAMAGVAIVVFVALSLAYQQVRRESSATKAVKRLVISLGNAPTYRGAAAARMALSPDGSHLGYVGQVGSTTQIMLRSLSSFETRPLSGTEGAVVPFFSPDGEWIGFFADGKMKKVSLEGGAPLTLCDVVDPNPAGASWAPDGSIYFVPSWVSGLLRVPATGGTPDVVVNPDSDKGERGFLWPQWLPGGAILLTVYKGGNPLDDARVLAYSLKTGERDVLVEGGGFARYVPTGHLLYVNGKTVFAVEFDAERMKTSSTPKPVLEGIPFSSENATAGYVYAGDGTLVYIPGATSSDQRSLVWVDRQGRERPLSAPRRPYEWPRLSPDGRRVAVTVSGETYDVWLYNLVSNTLSRLTFGLDDGRPIWFPDGRSIAFDSTRDGPNSIYRVAADGSGTVDRLTREDALSATSISPDGRFLIFNRLDPGTSNDIWMLPLAEASEPRPFLRTPFAEEGAAFSPNGRWLAYSSTETGHPEVFVRPFPGPGTKIQISSGGGEDPRWARNGRELFYRAGRSWMVLDVTLAPSFTVGPAKLLFEGPYWEKYDVSLDGQRLLMVKPQAEEAVRELHVVLNWFEELRRLASTDGK